MDEATAERKVPTWTRISPPFAVKGTSHDVRRPWYGLRALPGVAGSEHGGRPDPSRVSSSGADQRREY